MMPLEKTPPRNEQNFDFITPETPFATRHFTVFFDKNGEVSRTNTESIYAIDEDTAVEYAEKVMDNKEERGWISNYRYKVFSNEMEYGVVFVDGSMSRSAMMQSMTIAGIVLLGCAAHGALIYSSEAHLRSTDQRKIYPPQIRPRGLSHRRLRLRDRPQISVAYEYYPRIY